MIYVDMSARAGDLVDEADDKTSLAEHTCCICGAVLTNGKCMSCKHAQCEKCPLFVPQPTYEALKAALAAAVEAWRILGADNAALRAQLIRCAKLSHRSRPRNDSR